MFNSYPNFLVLAIALVLSFSVPLKAQDQPQDFLNAHNRARGAVGVSNLMWSQTLAIYARAYAEKRRDCGFFLSGGPYGETIKVDIIDFSAEQFVRTFLDQGSNYYDYATNTCRRAGNACDGYKQVLSRKTVFLGCAKVKCNNGGVFAICSYDPSAIRSDLLNYIHK
ncbi:unnamed protein product [Arabidopsis halleri]